HKVYPYFFRRQHNPLTVSRIWLTIHVQRAHFHPAGFNTVFIHKLPLFPATLRRGVQARTGKLTSPEAIVCYSVQNGRRTCTVSRGSALALFLLTDCTIL